MVLNAVRPPPTPYRRPEPDLERVLQTFAEAERSQVGYPSNQDFDYSDVIIPFLRYSGNNIGDPFQSTNFRLNTHDMEREVITTFADIMHLEQEQAWGYVTSGGTEGNMYGLFMARELFPAATVYHSQDTHYSVLKLLRLLNMKGVTVQSQNNGEMDYHNLRDCLQTNNNTNADAGAKTGAPAIIVANIGSTMKGAVDNLHNIHEVLSHAKVRDFYIHADAALSGMVLPFVEDPQPHGFDAGINSISVSGHKLIGAPWPCGIILTRKDYVDRIAQPVEYVGIMDTTIPGSRSALSPLVIRHAFRKHGRQGFRQIVAQMLDTAKYAVERFNSAGIPAWKNRNSPTVVFPKPAPEIFQKWQIASLDNIAHIITMPHVTREKVDELVED